VWHGDVAQREGQVSSARGVRVWPSSGVGAEEAQAEAHIEHEAHVCDAGGVKAQRLVESTRKLPSPKGGIRQRDDACGTRSRRCGKRRWKGESAAHAACVWPTARECRGRRRRRKRTSNMLRMAVTLEVSKLSGWLKACARCRVQREHPIEGRRVWHGEEMAQRGKGESAAHVACVRVWPSSGVGAEGAGGSAHLEHGAHVCDAGGVKAQRLVESIRILPCPKGTSDRGTTRVAHGDVAHRGKGESAAHTRRACVAQLGSAGRRRRGKRTRNIQRMSVTLEVSKLSGWLKASAPCRVQKGASDRGTTRVVRRCGTEGIGRISSAHAACVCGRARDRGQKAQVEAHLEHEGHVCDAAGVPARNVGIEVTQTICIEEAAHVGDARDVPVGDGAVLQFGGGHVGVVLSGRRLQFGLGRKDAKQAAVVSGWPGGVGGQEHRQPLRRARDGVAGLRQFARHTGLHRVRGVGAEGGGGADEDERAEARSALLRLRLRHGGIYKVRLQDKNAYGLCWAKAHTMPNRAQVAVEREELCRKSCKGCGYAVYRAVALELCLPI
jgi:hypothetical protein